jgi:hypothetical protein
MLSSPHATSVPVIDKQSHFDLPNPPPAPQASEDRAGGWQVTSCPESFFVHLDVVDRSQIHDYRLETHCILEKAMQELYPDGATNQGKNIWVLTGILEYAELGTYQLGIAAEYFIITTL